MKFHPDKSSKSTTTDVQDEESKNKEKQFAEISKAYSVLNNNQARANYDLLQNVRSGLRLGLLVKIFEINLFLYNYDGNNDDELSTGKFFSFVSAYVISLFRARSVY